MILQYERSVNLLLETINQLIALRETIGDHKRDFSLFYEPREMTE